MIYIQNWRDDRFWLVGPFDNVEQAGQWAEDPANNPTNDWRWQTTELSNPAAPIVIISPQGAMQKTAMTYILDLRDYAFGLVGPFDTGDQACEWAIDPINNPDNDPAWQVLELANPSTSVAIIPPAALTLSDRNRMRNPSAWSFT
jgi:hypothetical protein